MTNIEIIKDFFPSEILAVTTNRNYGFSERKFKSFNLSHSVNDSNEAVNKNRYLVQHKLKSDIVWMNQTHSTNIEFVEECTALVNADGLVSSNFNIACSVLTADCLPILACTSDAKIIGSVHAGWKGLSSGILENFFKCIVHKFLELGDKPQTTMNFSIYIWIGPSICKHCYEVGSDVKLNFSQPVFKSSKFFSKKSSNKWCCDLKLIAKYKVLEFFKDYENISIKMKVDKRCTYGSKNSFFSFRRDGNTGRMASLITFNK